MALKLPTFSGLALSSAVKLAILAAAIALGAWGGCSWQSSRDRAVLERKDHALTEAASALGRARDQLSVAASTLRSIDAETAAALARAQAAAADRRAEAEAARRETAEATRRAADVQARLDHAKRVPSCKKLLESASCAAFR